MIRIKIDYNLIDFNVMDALVYAMTTASPDVVAAIAARAPKRTGNLAKSIKTRRYTKAPMVRMKVLSNVPYARYVIEGTGLHGPKASLIYPVTAKVLHWTESGQSIFAASTQGQMPNDFPKKAFDTVKENLKIRIKQVIDDRIKA